jgi:ribosome modulation factor
MSPQIDILRDPIEEAYMGGVAAQRANITRSSNPYRRESLRTAWFQGWDASKQESLDKPSTTEGPQAS